MGVNLNLVQSHLGLGALSSQDNENFESLDIDESPDLHNGTQRAPRFMRERGYEAERRFIKPNPDGWI